MKTLPPLPPALVGRTLTDSEFKVLTDQYGISRGPSDCPTCQGKKTFTHAVDGEVYECNCMDQWLLHVLLAHAGIGKRYQQYTWADTTGVDPEVLKTAKTYVNRLDNFIQSGMGLIFYGEDKGTGKTLLSTLIAKKAIGAGYSVIFVDYRDMITMWADGWTDLEQRARFDARVRHVDLLVIDDIGREHINRAQTADGALDSVLRDRIASLRPTIPTTNLALEDMGDRYSKNILSLMAEAAMPVLTTGVDYRPVSIATQFDEAARGHTRPVTIG